MPICGLRSTRLVLGDSTSHAQSGASGDVGAGTRRCPREGDKALCYSVYGSVAPHSRPREDTAASPGRRFIARTDPPPGPARASSAVKPMKLCRSPAPLTRCDAGNYTAPMDLHLAPQHFKVRDELRAWLTS